MLNRSRPRTLRVFDRGNTAELDAAPGHVQPGDAALVLRWPPNPIDLPMMFGYVSGSEDIGVGRGEQIVHHHALVHLQPCLPRQVAVGPDTRGDHDQIGGNDAAVFQQNSLDPPVADDFSRDGLGSQLDAGGGDIFVEDFSRPLV